MTGPARKELNALADATGTAIGGVRKELDALADATGRALGEQRDQIAGEIGPALAAAQARAAALSARRAETIATLTCWLSRCSDDAA